MLRKFGILFVVLAMLVVAAGAYAFAAANIVPASNVGSGASTISGYTVSNIAYTFATGDPTQVADIQFDLNEVAGHVKIQLDTTAVTGDTAWDWTACVRSGAGNLHWTCTPGVGHTPLLTTEILNLNIAATSN